MYWLSSGQQTNNSQQQKKQRWKTNTNQNHINWENVTKEEEEKKEKAKAKYMYMNLCAKWFDRNRKAKKWERREQESPFCTSCLCTFPHKYLYIFMYKPKSIIRITNVKISMNRVNTCCCCWFFPMRFVHDKDGCILVDKKIGFYFFSHFSFFFFSSSLNNFLVIIWKNQEIKP